MPRSRRRPRPTGRPPQRTPLYRLDPPGALYRGTWSASRDDVTEESLDTDERLTDSMRHMARTMLRWRHIYLNKFPLAAFMLQDQLDSGYIGLHGKSGPMLDMAHVAALFGVPVEETHEALHELHASALLLMNDEGELQMVIPHGLLQ